jgi:TolB-like protein
VNARKLFFFTLILLLAPSLAVAGIVPNAARSIAKQIHRQMKDKIGDEPGGVSNVTIVPTSAVDLQNMNETTPISRQFTEEVLTHLVGYGYRVFEIRKGKEISMDAVKGERILTRNPRQISRGSLDIVAVLVGTYTATPENIRFNYKLVYMHNNEVLAMGSATVGVIDELDSLLSDYKPPPPPPPAPKPTVFTRLP